MSRIDKNGLKISSTLFEFINNEVIPGTNIKSDDFWNKFEKVVHELAPVNKNLINKRDLIQKTIDQWHIKNKDQFIGYNGKGSNPSSILIKNNNLHIDILIDSNHMIGKSDKASISDVVVESALSTIIDNEVSVAAVDGEDKEKCYRNWLGLMKGNLTANMEKNGKKFIRKLNPDRNYTSKDGKK